MKGVPTLSSVADEKNIARAEAAGRPSNWEDQRRTSYGGRRSRRNSVSDDSQLTIENFGGSQVKFSIQKPKTFILKIPLKKTELFKKISPFFNPFMKIILFYKF